MLYRMHLSITQDNIKIERPALTGLYFRKEIMSTAHNSANIEDVAKVVLMPGDPLRAKLIAENF